MDEDRDPVESEEERKIRLKTAGWVIAGFLGMWLAVWFALELAEFLYDRIY